MKVTRQYNMVCISCKGSGVIQEPFPTTTAITRMCPACSGSGIVIVNEIIEDEICSDPSKPETNPITLLHGTQP
jgi:DnaJ-class molecular chaperone